MSRHVDYCLKAMLAYMVGKGGGSMFRLPKHSLKRPDYSISHLSFVARDRLHLIRRC